MILIAFFFTGLIGYLCGSIPFGFIYIKLFKGKNLTAIGSGRTGGTNSLRAGGLGIGLLTSFSDVFKGALAILLTRNMLGGILGDVLPWAILLAGVMSVVGHNWSIFLRFRGGAGTGPNVGWAMALWWPMLPIAIFTMSGMLLTLGIASVASITMGAIIPVVFGFRYLVGIDQTPAYFLAGLVTLGIVVWALRPNLKRLIEGEERIVGPRARRIRRRQAAQKGQNGSEHSQ